MKNLDCPENKLTLIKAEDIFNAPFTEFAYRLCRELSNLYEPIHLKICSTIEHIYLYCKHKGIDIEYFIEQKMKYNETRPYKHGGKKY